MFDISKIRHATHLLVAVALVSVAACAGESSNKLFAEGAQQAMMDETRIENENRELVQKGFDAWSNGTGSPYDLLADDVSWTIVGNSDASRIYPSREAFMNEVIRPFNARMSEGLKPTIRKLITQGDMVMIFFDAAGVARDAKPYANTYAWVWKMAGGKVVEAHAFFDSIAFNDLWRRVTPAGADPA